MMLRCYSILNFPLACYVPRFHFITDMFLMHRLHSFDKMHIKNLHNYHKNISNVLLANYSRALEYFDSCEYIQSILNILASKVKSYSQ